MVAPNRFQARPMWSGTADPLGYVLPRTIEMARRIAAGGWALLTNGAAAIHPTAYVAPSHIALLDDSYIPGLWELGRAVHEEGAKCGQQLFYSGSLSNPAYQIHLPPEKRWVPAPSDAPPDWSYHGKPCRGMTRWEVEEAINCFVQSALRCQQAEMDYVQIHATHGSLPMQFLSPRWNRRTDEWGEDKTRFLRTIFREVKKAVGPNYPVSVNVSASEVPMPGENPPGYTEEYLYNVIAPMLVEEGCDWIDITVGTIAHIYGQAWLLGPIYFEQGYMTKFAKEVKKLFPNAIVGVPGKIMDPRMAERLVDDGVCDIVGGGRLPWADPDYPKKAMAGKYEDVRQCTGCSYCYSFFYLGKRCFCSVNPVFHQEYLNWEQLSPPLKTKKIMIVGGGICGMEFARVAKTRGHEVVLYEKKDALGGLVNIGADIPYVDTMDLGHIVSWEKTQLEKLGVETHLGTEANLEAVDRENPDAVVIATGSIPLIPDIPGIDGPNVMTIDTYLEEKPEITGKAVVIGAWEGAETALSLGRQGVEATLVSEKAGGLLGPFFDAKYFYGLYDRQYMMVRSLGEAKVETIGGATINRITDKGVEITVDGQARFLEASKVIVGFGRKPATDLASALKGKVDEIHILGDAREPRSTAEAIGDAYRTARLI